MIHVQPNILIAPNAFKHSLDAVEAAEAIAEGLQASRLSCAYELFPIGDGGNGTCRLLIERLGGTKIEATVNDPLGRPVKAAIGLIEAGRTAVIEMADASGLHLLSMDELNPLKATSYGTGQLIRTALDRGVRRIILGMGGSATVDGGSGMLDALGVRFLDSDGNRIGDLPNGLRRLSTIDRSALDDRLANVELTILCDVDNPLLGERGAATVFGPQKGATPTMVQELEHCLSVFAEVILRDTEIALADLPHGGVAGGASAGLHAVLGARLVNGIEYFLELTGFDRALERCDVVITAEGSIDRQTLQGKGPYGVARRAKIHGLPVIGLAGRVPSDVDVDLQEWFDVLLAIGHAPVPLHEALATTRDNLKRTAIQLGNLLAHRY